MDRSGQPLRLAPALLALAIALSGCSDEPTPDDPLAGVGGDTPEVEATETTGGIRGVVVDQAIRPIAGATVTVEGSDKSATSNADGLFAVSGLEAGSYVVEATHQLYDVMRQTVEVRAGVADPPAIKFQLTRVVFETPYMETIKFDGFIVCSTNIVVPEAVPEVGGSGLLSEECGEGVGVPGVGRVGGQGNNEVQFDFSPSNPMVKTIIVEQVWEPTSEAGRGFYTPVSTDWVCDPLCSGNTFLLMVGESPLYGRIDEQVLMEQNITAGTVVSTFTWAQPSGTNPVSVVLNQPYQTFVTSFYVLPAPEGWSFVQGSPNPF